MLVASNEACSESEEETMVEPEEKEDDELLTSEPAPLDPHLQQEAQSSVDPPELVAAEEGVEEVAADEPIDFPAHLETRQVSA